MHIMPFIFIGNNQICTTGYTIPNMGEYGAYDIVVNLLQKAPGNNKIFKINFDNYAREVEGNKRTFDINGYIKKAVEILENELNNDKPTIAMAMKYIIEENPSVFKGFQNLYKDQYAQYLKK